MKKKMSGKIENLSQIFELVSLGWWPSVFFCFSHSHQRCIPVMADLQIRFRYPQMEVFSVRKEGRACVR
jgi:hypothetical protein